MKFTKDKEVYEKDIQGFQGKASLIVIPDYIDEIKTIARMSKADIIPRGAGTSFTGACVPGNSIIIDMSKMNRILKIDFSRRLAYIEAGVTVDELNRELEKYNLEFPIEPLFPGIQTIGGMIATNAAGNRELKYGRVVNRINSLEIINGRGEVIETPKADSSDFVGMEGTTGIITKAKLHLTTKKKRTISILKSDSLDQILLAVKKLRFNQDISMLELAGKQLSVMLGLEDKYHLFVEFETDKGFFRAEAYNRFMKMRRKFYYTLASNGFTLLEDPKFFTEHLRDFIAYLEQQNTPYFSNLGSGIVYSCFKPEEKEKVQQIINYVKKARAKVSYNLGIGLKKKDSLEKNEREIIKRIKTRHDPEWKFNRNKVIDIILKEKPGQKQPEQQIEIKKIAKTPEQEIHELIEEEKIDELLAAKPIDFPNIIEEKIKIEQQESKKEIDKKELFEAIDKNVTFKKEDGLTEEEKEKIKKIAGGFFGKS